MPENKVRLNFFDVYENALRMRGWNCVELHRQTEAADIKVSLRALQRYKSRESLPTFQHAKEILAVLNIHATDDQIREALSTAEEQRFENQSRENYMQRGVRLRVSQLSDKLTDPGTIIMMLNDRVNSMPRNKRTFNQYVTALIRKDIDEHLKG